MQCHGQLSSTLRTAIDEFYSFLAKMCNVFLPLEEEEQVHCLKNCDESQAAKIDECVCDFAAEIPMRSSVVERINIFSFFNDQHILLSKHLL